MSNVPDIDELLYRSHIIRSAGGDPTGISCKLIDQLTRKTEKRPNKIEACTEEQSIYVNAYLEEHGKKK
jgi:hypothetical protein